MMQPSKPVTDCIAVLIKKAVFNNPWILIPPTPSGLQARSRRGRIHRGLGHWSWVIVWLWPWEQEVQVIEDTDHNNLQAKIIYLIFLWEDQCVFVYVSVYEGVCIRQVEVRVRCINHHYIKTSQCDFF